MPKTRIRSNKAVKRLKTRIYKRFKRDIKEAVIPGQKVLLYMKTNRDIISSDGRKIGKVERVVGTGTITMKNDQVYIYSPSIGEYKARLEDEGFQVLSWSGPALYARPIKG